MSAREPGYLHTGTIKYADLQSIFPFDNQLVLCSIKGRDLVSRFLETSNSSYFIFCGSYGNSIRGDIDPDGTYYLVTDTYSSGYAPNRLTEIARYDEDVFARDLLADYIREGNFDTGTEGYTSIAEILAIGANMPANSQTLSSYRVRGEIVEIYNTTYGNMILSDGQGNLLTVYGVNAEDGTRYDRMSDKPQVGDIVVLEAPIKRYVNNSSGEDIIELFQSYLVEKTQVTAIEEILSIGAGLADNAETEEKYRVYGEIVEIYNTTYGNMILSDGQGNLLTVYGVYDADGTRYDAMSSQPQVGDMIIVEAPIKRYVNEMRGENIIELFQATLIR